MQRTDQPDAQGGGTLEVSFVEASSLLVGRPRGALDGELARKLVELVEIHEVGAERGFNRFCDLTELERISLGVDEIASLAARRRNFNPNPIQVKSAFLVSGPLALGVVYIFKALLHSERIEVRWFDSLEEAAAWLQVSPEILRGGKS